MRSGGMRQPSLAWKVMAQGAVPGRAVVVAHEQAADAPEDLAQEKGRQGRVAQAILRLYVGLSVKDD